MITSSRRQAVVLLSTLACALLRATLGWAGEGEQRSASDYTATAPDGGKGVQAVNHESASDYTATVPDTLDLARRAEYAIHGLTQVLDPEMDYELWLIAAFGANPAHMYHENTGLPTNNPKFAESLPMMREMTGSTKHMDIQRAMMEAMLKQIGEDGLYYAPASGRPWHESAGHKVEVVTDDDYANVYGNSRFLLACMAWMQVEPDGPWRQYAEGVAKGLMRIAVQKEDYAYYPDNGVGEAFSFPRSGWRHTNEAETEQTGAERSMFMYHCGPIRALARWGAMTGDQEALDMAGRLVNFVMKDRFWGVPNFPIDDIDPEDRGYFVGHTHGHTAMIYALAEYAAITHDARLLNFVRDAYEFARHHGQPRLGAWRNEQPTVEVCNLSDMIATAIKLTEAGMGDYYDDVDVSVRNQLVESQILPCQTQALHRISAASPAFENPRPAQYSTDRVIERHVGTMIPLEYYGLDSPNSIHCCTGNGTQALYYAWSRIIEQPSEGNVQINLLLNRASPWMDIDSYIPYEGKAVLKNKAAKTAAVRIPYWIDRRQLEVSVNGKAVAQQYLANYLQIQNLSADDEVVLTFPLKEETVVQTHADRPYTIHFKGTTAMELTGPGSDVRYPTYQRQQYLANKAPMVDVQRHIEPNLIQW
jgi:hypothetical protein